MGSSTSRNALLLGLTLLGAAHARGQDILERSDTADIPTGPQFVSGQVVRPGKQSMIPVPHVMVTLHRVGSDGAAPLDSVRSDAAGHYQFHFARTGDLRALYFVSASYGGIAYFTPPFTHATVKGGDAEIAVFDTTSGPVPISARGHHVVVSQVDANGMRNVTEVYELANDSSVTRVASAGNGDEVWAALLPARASGFQVSQGDIPPQAVRFEPGKARVLAPIAPGLKQLSFSYSLPASAFPLRIPIVRETQILEVLIEGEKGTVSGSMLVEKSPVALERRTFRRFLAADVPANSVAVIDLPRDISKDAIDPRLVIAIVAVIAAAMILTLARALRRT